MMRTFCLLHIITVVVACSVVIYTTVNAGDVDTSRYSDISNTHNINTRDSSINGTCGKNLRWTLKDGVLTISGSGKMDNYESASYMPWKKQNDPIQTIIVEEGVESIGDFAFSECGTQSVFLPNSLISIGHDAFRYCTSLRNVTIPANVASIGDDAFCNCHYLTSIEVAEGNRHFKSVDGVLYSLDGTTIVAFPKGKTATITTYNVVSGVTTIGNGAFYGVRGISEIILPDSVTKIGDHAFDGCSALTSLGLPNKVKSIGSYAFHACEVLSSISIPDSVTWIGDYGFSNCYALTTVTIPVNVETIGRAPFQGCNSLKTINVASGNTKFASLIGVLFNANYTELIQYPPGETSTSYTIPSCATSIGDYAFSGCEKLTNVNILDSVTSIGNHCFEDCSDLISVSISSSVRSIGECAFQSCSSLRSVNIPGSVISVGNNAFSRCDSLNDLIISDGVKSIGEYAFSDCSSLKSVTIPASVEIIGDSAFQGCSGLTSIEVADGNSHFVSDDGVLYDREHTILIQYPASSDRSSYTILDGVKTIGPGAFCASEQLLNVSIPSSVVSIKHHAFNECSKLAHVDIPNGVTSIEDYAFCYCSSLKSITIPNGVKSVGSYAFNYAGLSSVSIPNSVISIGDNAFFSTSIEALNIPDSVKTLGYHVFSNCLSLENVTIPDSITFLGDEAFCYCTRLSNVFYQGSLDFPLIDAFRYSTPARICVSPDYKYDTFCGVVIQPPSSICEEFRGGFNHCFKSTYKDGYIVQEQRRNATLFEARSNGCVECHCYNEIGPVSWSLCNSSDTTALICIDDKCTEKEVANQEKEEWRVNIEFRENEVDPSELNASEVMEGISLLTGLNEDDIGVGIEIDENGNITRVILYVKDEKTATSIASAVEGCFVLGEIVEFPML